MTKMSKFRVLIISFFLAFTTAFVHAKDPKVVTDVNGNELRSGARYYIEVPCAPDFIPSVVSDTSHGFCPTGNVILSEFHYRLPISIIPVKSNSTVILEDTYLTVRFDFRYWCRVLISLVWKVDPGDRVTTGGVVGLNRFNLTKFEDGKGGSNKYQLAACPVSECLHDCNPVGYVEEYEGRYLVVGGEPFPIVFVPVKEPRIAYKLPSV